MTDPRADFDGAKIMVFVGGDLLALRRDHSPGIPWPGYLDFPGGAREGREAPEACALRETREEVGLVLTPDRLELAHLRQTGRETSWFFAVHLPGSAKADIRFGGEGAGWLLMPPAAFVADATAIPHFREILARYLAER